MPKLNRRQFVAMLAAWSAAGSSRAADSGRVLRVLSYNIHHGEGTDGRLDLPRIAQVITGCAPDVVALQEVDNKAARTGGVDQAAEIGRLTKLHFAFGRAMPYQDGEYGQALLSRWPLEQFAVHPLPNLSNREPRIPVSAQIRPPGMAAFRFVGTHLDHLRDDRDRYAQAVRLNELFAADSVPTVLAGDLNARPDSRVMQLVLTQWEDASAASPAFTSPAGNPTARIDYVLLRPPGAWRARRSEVLPEPVASDHRPLLVELGAGVS